MAAGAARCYSYNCTRQRLMTPERGHPRERSPDPDGTARPHLAMPLGLSRPSMEKADSRKPSLTRRMSSQISMARLEIRKSVFDLIGARTACSASVGALCRTCRSSARRRPLAGKPLPALPENWKSATDSEGRTYFWNEISNATTYSYPPHLPEGWHLARLRSDPNVVYFYNEWTRQTVKCDRPKPRARALQPTAAHLTGTTKRTSTA